jgi:hypothetical protein
MPKTSRILYVAIHRSEPRRNYILSPRNIAKLFRNPSLKFPALILHYTIHRIEVPISLETNVSIFDYVKAYNLINT